MTYSSELGVPPLSPSLSSPSNGLVCVGLVPFDLRSNQSDSGYCHPSILRRGDQTLQGLFLRGGGRSPLLGRTVLKFPVPTGSFAIDRDSYSSSVTSTMKVLISIGFQLSLAFIDIGLFGEHTPRIIRV